MAFNYEEKRYYRAVCNGLKNDFPEAGKKVSGHLINIGGSETKYAILQLDEGQVNRKRPYENCGLKIFPIDEHTIELSSNVKAYLGKEVYENDFIKITGCESDGEIYKVKRNNVEFYLKNIRTKEIRFFKDLDEYEIKNFIIINDWDIFNPEHYKEL